MLNQNSLFLATDFLIFHQKEICSTFQNNAGNAQKSLLVYRTMELKSELAVITFHMMSLGNFLLSISRKFGEERYNETHH